MISWWTGWLLFSLRTNYMISLQSTVISLRCLFYHYITLNLFIILILDGHSFFPLSDIIFGKPLHIKIVYDKIKLVSDWIKEQKLFVLQLTNRNLLHFLFSTLLQKADGLLLSPAFDRDCWLSGDLEYH